MVTVMVTVRVRDRVWVRVMPKCNYSYRGVYTSIPSRAEPCGEGWCLRYDLACILIFVFFLYVLRLGLELGLGLG